MNFQLPDVPGLPASLQSASQSASDKLLQAATLSNVARVAIARLPEQILRISLPGEGKSLPLDIRLPSARAIKDSAPTFITRAAGTEKSTAVLLQALEQRGQQTLTPKTEVALTQYLTRQLQAQPDSAITIQARVVSVSANTLTIKTDPPANQSSLSLPLKMPPASLKPNDAISVTVKPIPKGGFDVAVMARNSPSSSPLLTTSGDSKALSNAVNALILAKLSQTGITLKQTALLPVPKQLDSLNPAAIRPQQLSASIGNVLSFRIDNNTKETAQLITRQTYLQPVMKIPLSQEIVQNTRIPVLGKSDSASISLSALPLVKSLPVTLSSQLAENTGAKFSAGHAAPQPASVSDKEKLSGLPDASKAKLAPEEQAKVHAQIIELSRVLLKDTGSTKEALSQLIQILTAGKANTGTQTRQTINQLLAAIQGADPKLARVEAGQTAETTSADTQKAPAPTLAQQLQSLMSSPALPLTPVQLSTPAQANNLVAGLVMLLQLTLAGRAINRQPALASQADAPEQLLQKVVTQSQGGSSSPARVSQDLASLESRSQFLNQVKTLLANHQQHKLSQADSRLLGQESLYYVLPLTSQKGAPPELLIRPDERGARQADASGGNKKLWNVTMKLDIGALGELLAKSRIDGDVIELDLYTSTEGLLQRVADTLPLLKRRLTALGLEVAHSSFQRGKIPSTLNDRPYHIFETQA